MVFWEKVISEINGRDPDVVFLAEAFTRPAMMHTLGRIEVPAVLHVLHLAYRQARAGGLPRRAVRSRRRVHAAQLLRQHPGHPARVPAARRPLRVQDPRAVLAATLSPTWGVYSGFELFEHRAGRAGRRGVPRLREVPVPASRVGRRRAREGRSLAPYITTLNRGAPAPSVAATPAKPEIPPHRQRCGDGPSSQAHPHGSMQRISWWWSSTLDPHATHEATVSLDMPALGMDWQDTFPVHDAFTGASYRWGQRNYVRLDPAEEPAHLFSVRRNNP
ncbi:hypothetical protein ACU686_39750 [Yinghuangia aomiensis]